MAKDKDKVSITSRDPHIISKSFQINYVILKSTELVNLPDAKIDNNFIFHQHISDLCRRASYQLCTLSRFSGVLDIEVSLK